MIVAANDFYSGKALIEYGEYAQQECNLIYNIIRPGDVVLDVGANIGALAVPMMRRVEPLGRVLAFEPQPMIARLLAANLALNSQGGNSHALNCAIGNDHGFVDFPVQDYEKGNFQNFGRVSMEQTDVGVPLRRLDEFVLPNVAFIKIDVEGWETAVLQGAHELIARCRPIMLIENDRVEEGPTLMEELEALAYRCWWAMTPLYSPDNFNKRQDNMYGVAASMDMLCIPTEKEQTLAERLVLRPANIDTLDEIYRSVQLI